MIREDILSQYSSEDIELLKHNDSIFYDFRCAVSKSTTERIAKHAYASIVFLSNKICSRQSSYDSFLNDVKSYGQNMLKGIKNPKSEHLILKMLKECEGLKNTKYMKCALTAVEHYVLALNNESEYVDGMMYELSLVFHGVKDLRYLSSHFNDLQNIIIESVNKLTETIRKENEEGGSQSINREYVRLIYEEMAEREMPAAQLTKEEQIIQKRELLKEQRSYKRVHTNNLKKFVKDHQTMLEELSAEDRQSYYKSLYDFYKKEMITVKEDTKDLFICLDEDLDRYLLGDISRAQILRDLAKLRYNLENAAEIKIAIAIEKIILVIKIKDVTIALSRRIFDFANNSITEALNIENREIDRVKAIKS